jgi:hypothetical protein
MWRRGRLIETGNEALQFFLSPVFSLPAGFYRQFPAAISQAVDRKNEIAGT